MIVALCATSEGYSDSRIDITKALFVALKISSSATQTAAVGAALRWTRNAPAALGLFQLLQGEYTIP